MKQVPGKAGLKTLPMCKAGVPWSLATQLQRECRLLRNNMRS